MAITITSTDNPNEVKAALTSRGIEVEVDGADEQTDSTSTSTPPAKETTDSPDDNTKQDQVVEEKKDDKGDADDDSSVGAHGKDDTKAQDQDKDDKADDQDDEPKPKKMGGFQKKIARQEAEIQRLKGQLEESRRQGEPKGEQSNVYIDRAKPKKSDFSQADDPEGEWTDAVAEWHAENREAKVRFELQQQQAQQEHEEVRSSHNTRVEQVAGEGKIYPDYEEVLEAAKEEDIPLTPIMQKKISKSGISPDLIYYFAKNPEIAQEIAAIGSVVGQTSEMDAVIDLVKNEVKKLESKISKSKPSGKTDGGKDGGKKTKTAGSDPAASDTTDKPKPSKKAPDPINPLGSGKGPMSSDLEQVAQSGDFKAYEERRKSQGFKYR